MDDNVGGTKVTLKPCTSETANVISHTAVWWMNPLYKLGYKRKLKITDLFEVAKKDRSVKLTSDLERNWEKELAKSRLERRKPSFRRAFLKTYICRFFFYGIFALATEVFRCLGPIFIGELSVYFTNPDDYPGWYGYAYATGILLSSFLSTMFGQIMWLGVQVLGWNSRTSVTGLMYKKTLKLNHEALSRTTTGQIVNLSSTDAMRFDFAFHFTNYLWIAPLECAAVVYILWLRLGPSPVVGMSVLFVLMAMQGFIGKMFGKLRLKTAKITDERVRMMNEIISGMRIIKMYTWENSFHKLVSMLRSKELRKIFMSSLLRSFNFTCAHSTSQMLTFATFMVFVAINGQLTTQAVFVAIGLFTIMRVGVGVFFPFSVEKLSEVLVAIKRIEAFLLLPEVVVVGNKDGDDCSIEIIDYTGTWQKIGKLTLENISLKADRGKLVTVIGPVGAGKSSLLSAILGELPTISGEVKVHGKLGYSSQIAWLFSESVRDNILFGEDYEVERYNEVVRSCALERDFEILPLGDQTLVGERGVTLSGGQKARVGLARLAYRSDVDIALFDDPLSAVDPEVANHLYNECICGLMQGKVRVLVTHQLQFLYNADEVIIMKEGSIVDRGTFTELQKRGTDFTSLLKVREVKEPDDDVFSVTSIERIMTLRRSKKKSLHGDEQKMNLSEVKRSEKEPLEETMTNDAEEPLLEMDELKTKIVGSKNSSNNNNNSNNNNKNSNKPKDKLSAKNIGLRLYYEYFKCGVHAIYLVVLITIILGNHVLLILSDWWITKWASDEETYRQELSEYLAFHANQTFSNSSSNVLSPSFAAFDKTHYISVYALLTIGFLVSMFIRTVMHFYLCISSSVQLHIKMLSAILKAKIRFFDTNPVGSVLNRFSKDMSQVDELLPAAFGDVFFLGGSIVAIIIFVITVNYFVLVIVIPIFIYFVWIRRYYVRTSREIKRIEGARRSPVFSHLSSSLHGLITIRTFKMQQEFIEKHHKLQDIHGAAWSLFINGARWFGFRLDLLTAIFISAVAYLSVILVSVLPDASPVNASNLGLTLTLSITLLSSFQWAVRQSAEAENLMTSVERIREYHDIPPESSDNDVKIMPDDKWPLDGAITMENMSCAYFSGGPIVLKNINLEIKPREKVGIVGRTGAGKSSMIETIFRMSDQITGMITIDGIDTSMISLHNLRSAIAIIPQDPVLFSGTMRRNLDAFSNYTDDALWDALEQVQLKSLVENLPLKLETELAESGSNFSVGQRQLVCLARAILRSNQILIIDEATANVDIRTDRLIQDTIRRRFLKCTVLTIAHRLNTIIDSDRILVLDDGRVVEFDEPHLLLEDDETVFSEMVKMTGEHENELRRVAHDVYDRNRAINLDDSDDRATSVHEIGKT